MPSINIKFPFKETYEGGMFATNKTTQDAIRTDLICLLTTKRWQRPMRGDFYSPLFDYIMEPWDNISESELEDKLIDKIANYIPEVTVRKIKFDFQEQENLLNVSISYEIPRLGNLIDNIEISVPTEVD